MTMFRNDRYDLLQDDNAAQVIKVFVL
jgi:hypothetical protein